ncbi:MAG: class I SAM-dependent methyltransferase [Desulfamplus sp.]|nr:class I SAM-dependent methyltransferase [Desulfamplus sp.]
MIEKYISKRPCPVCVCKEATVVAQLCYALFDDLEISGDKTLVQCCRCGMLYDDINFSEKQLNEYYRINEHYAASASGGSGSASEDNRGRYDRIISLIESGSDGVVIDFGCGQGGFVSRCIEHGLKAVGIESSVKSRDVAQKQGLQVYDSINTFIAENHIPNLKAVVFSHILEHVIYPVDLLNTILQYSNRDTLIYIEVPDAESYILPKIIHWQKMYFEHLSHFKKNNIAELLKYVGIEIIQEGLTNFSELQKDNHCIYIIGRFAEKSKKERQPLFFGYKYENILLHPDISFDNIPKDDRPLALWGVSQYSMLLFGFRKDLLWRVIRLFDSSPAKIGRKIKGIIVEHSNNLDSLSDEYIFLLPKSNYIFEMRNQLSAIGFKGLMIEV